MQMISSVRGRKKSGSVVSGWKIPIPTEPAVLSSAIASNLAKGAGMEEAVQKAKEYLTEALKEQLDLGAGSGPMDHTLGKIIFE